MRKIFILMLCICSFISLSAEEEKQHSKELEDQERRDVTGYWFMYDLGKEPTGIAYLYEYNGRIYGRTLVTIHKHLNVVETYDKPQFRSQHIEGKPFSTGQDIIWNLQWDPEKRKYIKGYILDPRKKKPYYADIWREGDTLKIFGNVGAGLGMVITWRRAQASDLPEGTPPVKGPLEPKIYYEVKKKWQ